MKYPREVQAIPGTLNINALTGTIQNFSQVGIAGDVTGGSAKLYVNGNVGIGTTGPGALLDVQKDNNYAIRAVSSGASAYTGIALDSGTVLGRIWSDATYNSNAGAMIVGPQSVHKLILRTSNTDRLTIDTSGNVGIGTTGPGAMLDVAGTIRASGEITGTMGSGYGQFRMVSGNYGAFFRNDGSNTYLLLTNSGDQYGQWNSLRPIYVSNSDGTVYFGNLVRGATYGFGGMWTWQTDPARCGQTNPFTGGCSCPSGFTDKQLPGSLGCAGNDCTQLHYCYK